ncbi:hypothetical protein ACL9RF_07335 [Sphingobacterium sp. Mn56C]|uniref:hypothetical protein n=1 Tax=Sphingobacterium sp. Mn56C TaxID=3395261 RepID=UPI003BE01B74
MKKNVLKFSQSGGIAKSLLILSVALFLSCQKNIEPEVVVEEPQQEEEDPIVTDSIVTTKVRVNLMAVVFEDEQPLYFENYFLVKGGNRQQQQQQQANAKESQDVTIDLDNNYFLRASLTANGKQSPTLSSKGIVTPYEDIKYKVVVFDDKGNYVCHKDFVNKRGGMNELDMLMAEKTYTFIVYSINSALNLPDLIFEHPTKKTLKTANVNLGSNVDFLYYRKDLTLSATKENKLPCDLKHVFSEITTTIDATATGYPIHEIKSNFKALFKSTTVNLSNLQVKPLHTMNANLTFPAIKVTSKIIESSPMVINSSNGISFEIPSIKIGLLTFLNIKSVNNFKLKPGVRYTLNIKIIPDDMYVTHRGLPAARINGVTWMRHNLGVNINLDPDITKMTVDYHGNYYQWGRDFIAASGKDMKTSTFSFPVILTQDMWYPGTDKDPKKGECDPCPKGFRIPTGTEFLRLINYTTTTNIGEFKGEKRWHKQYPNDFSVAKVFTSMRNSKVKLIFPAQGIMDVGYTGHYWDKGVLGRAGAGVYHASSVSEMDVYSTHLYFDATTVTLVENKSTSNDIIAKVLSYNIRCIAE